MTLAWAWRCTTCDTEVPVEDQNVAFEAAAAHLEAWPECRTKGVEVGDPQAGVWPAGILYMREPDRSPAPLWLKVLNRILGRLT